MTTTPQPRHRVRVWFGEHVSADYNAEAASAERYAHAMSGRFAGPRVTNDPSPSAPPASRRAAEVVDHTRPALLGYVLEIFFTTPAQQADTRQQLIDFAAREGYTLHSIVFERLDTTPAAFERLVELAKRDNVTTVAIPRPDDLEAGQRQRLAVEAGAHVVVAGLVAPQNRFAAPAVNEA